MITLSEQGVFLVNGTELIPADAAPVSTAYRRWRRSAISARSRLISFSIAVCLAQLMPPILEAAIMRRAVSGRFYYPNGVKKIILSIIVGLRIFQCYL